MQYKILLVDDNRYLRESVSLLLTEKGFEVISVCSVVEASQYLNQHTPDIIISDVVMPQSDGYELIKYVRSINRLMQTPFILLTAKGMTTDRIKGYNLGCNAYLSKPFDPTELVSIINNLVTNNANKGNKVRTECPKTLFNYDTRDIQIVNVCFTPRELSVLELVIQGLTNRDIAKVLHTSKRNVEKYVSRLLAKTKTRNRTELAQYILRDLNYNLNSQSI